MHALSIKLPADLFLRLDREASSRNIGRSALVREILERNLEGGPEPERPSCADLAGDLVGCVASGRPDLATNRELLERAVLEDSLRGAPDSHS